MCKTPCQMIKGVITSDSMIIVWGRCYDPHPFQMRTLGGSAKLRSCSYNTPNWAASWSTPSCTLTLPSLWRWIKNLHSGFQESGIKRLRTSPGPCSHICILLWRVCFPLQGLSMFLSAFTFPGQRLPHWEHAFHQERWSMTKACDKSALSGKFGNGIFGPLHSL